MASLLDYSNQGWWHDTLNLLFSPRDKELIKSIPLCGKLVEDALVWPYTLTGSYIVKTGYDFSTNQGAWIMESTSLMTTNYGRKYGECKSSLRSENFCGGPLGTQFQKNTIEGLEWYYQMIAVITAIVSPGMCSMHFGCAPPFLRYGPRTVRGIAWAPVHILLASMSWWKQSLKQGRT